jgi:hypothetical protein
MNDLTPQELKDMALEYLKGAGDYLREQSLGSLKARFTIPCLNSWQQFTDILDARIIVARAYNVVKQSAPPVLAPEPKPEVTVIVIDFDKLERDVLKHSLADGDVQDLLPFHSKRVEGRTYVHIMNNSGYTVETNSHIIRKGETLCAHHRPEELTYAGYKGAEVTCPGCLTKGKAIVVNHLLNQLR